MGFGEATIRFQLAQRAASGRRARRTAALTAVLTAVVILVLPSLARSYSFPPGVEQTGPEQILFDWSQNRCQDENIPDAPPRAVRDSWNRLQLLVTHWVNYRLIGRNFDDLKLDCRMTMGPLQNPNPAAYADKEWISSPYTIDGTHFWALGAQEFQGNTHASMCMTGNYFKCLYMSINLFASSNRGDTWAHGPPPTQVVATTPYQYFKDDGPYGPTTPTNIVRNPRDGYYYSMIRLQGYLAQKAGTCVMRTRALANPTSWRAWDGSSFSTRFKLTPYNVVRMERAEPFACEPVDYANIEKMTGSITWNKWLEKWMLIDTVGKYEPSLNHNVYGVYYALSDDLVHWDDRQLLMHVATLIDHVCGDEDPLVYPSAIDHSSRSRNFETTDQSFYLYFTRIHYASSPCYQTLDRDLVRVPIRFTG